MSISITENIDCMEFMARLPDAHFDFIIADPWYGIGMSKNDVTGFAKRRFRVSAKGNDEAPPKEHFEEMKRIGKNLIVWGGNYFLEFLGNCRAPYIWDKGTGANYFADGEMAWTSFKTGCLRIFKHQWCGAFKDSERGETLIHPCQKPVALYKDLFSRFVKPGMTIYSPYLGSGADRIAAADMNFDFYGTELDKDYFDAQERRFSNHIAQGRLFEPEELRAEQLDLLR